MSKLLENKDTVRIVVESVVLLGVVFYFSNKNKKLMEYIGDLTQRLEEQEERLEKLEMVFKVNNDKRVTKPVNTKPASVKPVATPLLPVIEDEPVSESDDSDEELPSGSELDSLIKEELEELKTNLKKE